ncbi:glycosyl hydrolase [Hymenobacter persicinus]|nr:glycosyl hydrolase [Hymenobacter persicinus]
MPPLHSTAPIVIRQGGTYTGTYRSLDSDVPCVRIATREPVTLRNCELAGAGNLIQATDGGAQLTIVNCRGYGQRPSQDEKPYGRFLEVNSGKSVTVEHNYFEHTTGINVYLWGGDGSAAQTLTVRYNEVRNIDGRYRHGGGTLANFLGLNGVASLGNIEIAWNQIINAPDSSLVEDNISFYNSGGTAASPTRIHDNYIQGAYPYPATSPTYAGSGITLDGDAGSAIRATAYVRGSDNQLVSTCAALNIAAGHHNSFTRNRIVTSGLLPDGRRLVANYAAIGLWNEYKKPAAVFSANSVTGNIIGFVHWGGHAPFPDRQDLSPGACSPCTGTTHLPNPITLQTEQHEWQLWQQKLRQNRRQVGPMKHATAVAQQKPARP